MFYSIAIDGPAGAGKSTIAKKVAKQLLDDEKAKESKLSKRSDETVPLISFTFGLLISLFSLIV